MDKFISSKSELQMRRLRSERFMTFLENTALVLWCTSFSEPVEFVTYFNNVFFLSIIHRESSLLAQLGTHSIARTLVKPLGSLLHNELMACIPAMLRWHAHRS